MNIYLDVDGVLLTKHGEPAEGVTDFLRYVVNNHTVYWLTTHCKGDSAPLLAHLKGKLPEEAYELIQGVKPTTWNVLKTDGIDFSQDFKWFDDYVMESEKKVLEEHNAAHKQVFIDLKNNPKQLSEAIEKI